MYRSCSPAFRRVPPYAGGQGAHGQLGMICVMSPSTSRALLLEIARCPIVGCCLTGETAPHPCARVVLHQWLAVGPEDRQRRWRREHHLPEPWVGHIEAAAVLFLSSNPSLSKVRDQVEPAPAKPRVLERLRDAYLDQHPSLRRAFEAPKWEWQDDELQDRFEAAFEVWMDSGTRPIINAAGELGRVVPFWRAVKEQSEVVLGREAVPGRDYALTEVVHCKSQREVGVAAAMTECVSRYLRRVLALSPARLLVVYGRPARNAIRSVYSYPDPGVLSPPLEIEGLARRVAFLGHPNARRSKYPKQLAGSNLADARSWLTGE